MKHHTKGEIDRLVNIWIDGMLSASRDAGWKGDGPIAMFMEYGQWVGTGFDRSNQAMIIAIESLRKEHANFKMINAVMREIARESVNMFLAIGAKNAFRGLNPATERPWEEVEKAAQVGLTEGQYFHHLRSAYLAVDRELGKFERYREAV